ncbi:MAG: beta strand repeat-containing protein [Bacteriovorax sp.]
MFLRTSCGREERGLQESRFHICRDIALVTILVLFSGCIAKNKVVVTIKNRDLTSSKVLDVTVSNVQVINHQIIITGTNLNAVSNFKINEGATNTDLQIESQSNTSLVANTLSNVTFAAGKIFDFILSNANAASSFTVNFSLCDSTLGGKAFNCSITPNDKEVLSFDAASGKWKPRAMNGLSYQGAWDAGTALPSTTTAGDYYIVSVASGVYSVGDWIVFNGTAFDRINNSTVITNVFGRTGAISATKGDYVLTKMGDVDLTTAPPIIGDVLKYNGINWVPGTLSAGNVGTVTNVSGTAPISVATGTSTPVISMAQATGSANGYLSSTDWNTFNNKQASIVAGTTAQYYRGDKSFQTLDTSAVAENANLYFTNARVLGVPLAGFDNTLTGQVAATDTVLQAFGKTQKQINSLTTGGSNYLIKNGPDTLSGAVSLTNVITASGAGDIIVNSIPLGMTSAVNKAYADGKLDKTTGGTVSGVVTLDSDLKIKGGTTNYVTIKGHATSAAYNLILPSSAGTSGYFLQTDGAGNLSWASSSSMTLANGNILVGSAGNVATAVTMSGDATLSSTGIVTLKNTGTAGTYTTVTTDAQGRVTGGSNPTVVTSISGTAPVTIGGTAAVPVVSMAAATTAVDGYLKSTDWNIFNNKQAALSSGATINGIVYPATALQTLQVPLAPVALTDAVNKQYVDSFGQWTTSAGNAYRTTGNVGIGTSSPNEALQVNGNIAANAGQVYSAVQTSSAASPLTFNANTGNVMTWTTNTASPSVNVNNMKAGGSYMLVVSGTGTGSVAINCFSDAGVTSLPGSFVPANGARTSGTLNKSVYTLISDGTNCLITWMTGF